MSKTFHSDKISPKELSEDETLLIQAIRGAKIKQPVSSASVAGFTCLINSMVDGKPIIPITPQHLLPAYSNEKGIEKIERAHGQKIDPSLKHYLKRIAPIDGRKFSLVILRPCDLGIKSEVSFSEIIGRIIRGGLYLMGRDAILSTVEAIARGEIPLGINDDLMIGTEPFSKEGFIPIVHSPVWTKQKPHQHIVHLYPFDSSGINPKQMIAFEYAENR